MAGVIGASRFGYDIWGDAVNSRRTARKLKRAGKIHVSAAFCKALGGSFRCAGRGATALKGVGEEETWFLVGEGRSPMVS